MTTCKQQLAAEVVRLLADASDLLSRAKMLTYAGSLGDMNAAWIGDACRQAERVRRYLRDEVLDTAAQGA